MNEIIKNLFDGNNIIQDKYMIKNNVLYFRIINYIEVARIIDNNIYINFSISVKKQFMNIIKYCLDNNIMENRIKLVSNLFPEKCSIDWDKYNSDNIMNMLDFYINPEIFYSFKKLNFDFIKSLACYLDDMDLFGYFNDFCKRFLISRYIGKEKRFQHHYSIRLLDVWIIEDSEIRNSLANIVRKVKIKNMLRYE